MISCKEAARLMSESLDHELPLHKQALLKVHLGLCKLCLLYQKQITGLKQIFTASQESQLTSAESGPALSEKFRDHLKTLLRKK